MTNTFHKFEFATAAETITEIINLKSILNLPKGTEHFISDLHGEFDAFQHVLKNASGSIKEKIQLCFNGKLTLPEKMEFTFLVYYPQEMIAKLKADRPNQQLSAAWYETTILNLIELIHFVSSKYTRSKVRKALPANFAYVTEEMLYREANDFDKSSYYDEILTEIIRLEQGEAMICGLAQTVQQLVVDHLHVVGDIFDRGPAPDQILDALIDYHSLDIQWGNHDITWMGANSGSPLCVMNVLRISARYHNLSIIEDNYGINLRPLQSFAEAHYHDHPNFRPKVSHKETLSESQASQIAKMQQAVAVIQFKLEAQLIKRRPEFQMEHRLLLEMIDYEQQTITIKGEVYPLVSPQFPTIDPLAPEKLTAEETEIVEKLVISFCQSEKLSRHIEFLMEKGQIYLCYNNNLLIHGCIPLEADGSFKSLTLQGRPLAGKELLDTFEAALRYAFAHPEKRDDLATDLVWYLWTGETSSLFGKNEMTTFERYYIAAKATHQEQKNPYYQLRNEVAICSQILNDFGLDEQEGHIINGHTPVKEIAGESPIKAQGKLLVIDGGFSKPYQATTGIAGYTLISNSYGMVLVSHQPFHSKELAIANYTDIVSSKRIVDRVLERVKVKDTNTGKALQKTIKRLEQELTLQQALARPFSFD